MTFLYFIPVGKLDANDIQQLKFMLEEKFVFSIKISPQEIEPSFAYHERRGQHLATALLKTMKMSLPSEASLGLGITEVDLFVPHLNFVFGLAEMGGKVALISFHRLHPEYYDLPEDRELFYSRILKEAVHELGHTLGLVHCHQPDCVMYFSNSLADTDRKKASYCLQCRPIISRYLREKESEGIKDGV